MFEQFLKLQVYRNSNKGVNPPEPLAQWTVRTRFFNFRGINSLFFNANFTAQSGL